MYEISTAEYLRDGEESPGICGSSVGILRRHTKLQAEPMQAVPQPCQNRNGVLDISFEMKIAAMGFHDQVVLFGLSIEFARLEVKPQEILVPD